MLEFAELRCQLDVPPIAEHTQRDAIAGVVLCEHRRERRRVVDLRTIEGEDDIARAEPGLVGR